MKRIKATDNPQQWPRQSVKSIDCRRRDLVIRIADWSRDRDEPAFDVEVYVGGVYDFNLSRSETKFKHGSMRAAKAAAVQFAQSQIANLL